jgi:hypothetical protein
MPNRQKKPVPRYVGRDHRNGSLSFRVDRSAHILLPKNPTTPEFRAAFECRRSPQKPKGRRPKSEKPPGDDWRGVSYCRTSKEPRRSVREHVGRVDPNAVFILAALPPSIDAPRKARTTEACPLERLHPLLGGTQHPPTGNGRMGSASAPRDQAL